MKTNPARARTFWSLAGATLLVCAIAAMPAEAASISTNPVVSLDGSGTVTGSSIVIRNGGGLAMSLDSSGIAPGTAVTVWWVILEEGTCLVTYAAGHVIGENGSANFAGSIATGEERAGEFGCDAPLKDPATASVRLFVRSHGPAIPSLLPDQIDSFDGGCSTFLSPPDVPSAEGECGDIQRSVHNP